MAKTKVKEEITVVAELIVSSSEGTEVIRSFDRAHHRAWEIARRTTPVKITFNGFVRKD